MTIKKIITVWMSRNNWESKTVQYQLSYQWPEYAEQLHISAYWCCQYQLWLHSFLVLCVTFCDSLLPFPHSVPPTSKQISNQEIAMFWMQQVHIKKKKKLAATSNFAGWKMDIMSYRNYVWLSDSKLQGVIIWCVLLTDPRMMMYLFYKGRKSVKCLQVI